MVNKENINKVIDWIKEDQGAHLHMCSWFESLGQKEEGYDPEKPHWNFCNTAFCIGGYAFILAQQEKLKQKGKDVVELEELNLPDVSGREIETTAREYLGLTTAGDMIKAHHLFTMHKSMDMENFDGLPQAQRAEAAINVLEHLRDTGNVDWNHALLQAGVPMPDDDDDD